MKKYLEVLEQINAARAAITDSAKAEKEFELELLRKAVREADSDATDAARARYKAAEALYIQECDHNTNYNIAIQILTDNAAQALFTETIHLICDIWNKYAGKQHGEKTAQKIRDEIRSATGYSIYINNKYDDARISLYIGYNQSAPFTTLEFAPIWNGSKQPALDANNKIVPIIADNMKVCYRGAYVENIADHVHAIREAHAAAKKAEKAFHDAINNYNALTRGTMQKANPREYIKNWII